MKRNAANYLQFAAGLLLLVVGGWVLTGRAAGPSAEGMPTDWSHRHLIFSQPATTVQAMLLAGEPRFWQQEYRRAASSVATSAEANGEQLSSTPWEFKAADTAAVGRDWSQNLGSGGGVGAGNYPAKYSFRADSAKCPTPGPPDFVVFSTGLFGSPTQANIVAYDNLYSGCGGTVPQVYWAYNLNGGLVTTSPVFSANGDQLAFTGSNGTAARLVLLRWQSSTTETVSNPLLVLPSGVFSYFGCTAPPCMTTIALTDGSGNPTNDTTSSVFYDYGFDIAWVGDSAGWLHKFHPVFSGVPEEIRTSPWPVQVNPTSATALTSPVHDRFSDNVFVGDQGGFLARVNGTTGAVTLSGRLDFGTGLRAGPIVDPSAGIVYAFSSNDGSAGAQACGTGPCAAVYALAETFGSGTKGNKAQFGVSSATPKPMYAGAFDSTYLNSTNGTGRIHVCGNTGGVPTLYQVGIGAGAWNLPVTTGPALASAATGCSPVTDILNPNATGGATEWLFAGVQNNGLGAGLTSSCAAGGCLMNFKDQPWTSATAYSLGQEIIDNHFQVQVVTTAGTSKTGGPPSWATTLGTVTGDNTVRWRNQGPQVAAHALWQSSHAYATGIEIVDSNNNIQLVTTAGTSRTAAQGHPAWNTTAGVVTADASVRWRNLGSAATANIPAAGGTSGIIVDNTVGTGTMAGASRVYFSTQSNQACGTSGTGGCAVQASQSALQ